MNGIDLAQDKDRWRALLRIVMKFQVAQNSGNFLTSRGTVRFFKACAS